MYRPIGKYFISDNPNHRILNLVHVIEIYVPPMINRSNRYIYPPIDIWTGDGLITFYKRNREQWEIQYDTPEIPENRDFVLSFNNLCNFINEIKEIKCVLYCGGRGYTLYDIEESFN